MEPKNTRDCRHGQLARRCDICWLEGENEQLQAKLDRAVEALNMATVVMYDLGVADTKDDGVWALYSQITRIKSELTEPNNESLELAASLREHNAWRRGEGKYDGEPSVEPMPHTPKQLGKIIDQSAAALEAYARAEKMGVV